MTEPGTFCFVAFDVSWPGSPPGWSWAIGDLDDDGASEVAAGFEDVTLIGKWSGSGFDLLGTNDAVMIPRGFAHTREGGPRELLSSSGKAFGRFVLDGGHLRHTADPIEGISRRTWLGASILGPIDMDGDGADEIVAQLSRGESYGPHI